MICDLTDISCATGPAIGSIRDLRIIRTRDIISLPRPGWGSIAVSPFVEIVAGKSYADVALDLDTGQYSDEENTTAHGSLIQHRITGDLRRLRGAVDLERAKLIDGYYIAEFTDGIGNRRRVGTLDSPCRMLSSSSTRQQRSTAQGYSFQLSAVSRYPAAYIGVACSALGEEQFIWEFVYSGNQLSYISIFAKKNSHIYQVVEWQDNSRIYDQNGNFVEDAIRFPDTGSLPNRYANVAPILAPGPGEFLELRTSVQVELTTTQRCTINLRLSDPPQPFGAFSTGFSGGFL